MFTCISPNLDVDDAKVNMRLKSTDVLQPHVNKSASFSPHTRSRETQNLPRLFFYVSFLKRVAKIFLKKRYKKINFQRT